MGASWAAFLHDPNANRLADLAALEAFALVRVENGVGALTLTMPYAAVPYSYYKRDGLITLERASESQSSALFTEQVYFITGRRRRVGDDGSQRVVITALDANCLLARRSVLYAAGTSYADKTGNAGDVMRAIVRENLGASASASRQIAALTVGADLGDGASVSKAFAWRNVLVVLQELAKASATAGTYIAFDMVCTKPPGAGTLGLEFRTYQGQRGSDHRYPSGAAGPVMLGPDFGNMADVDYAEEWNDEVNHATALGQGEGSARATSTSSDSARYGASPYALCEGVTDARNTSSTTALADEADNALRAGLPVRTFGGRIVDTAGVRFGIEYGFGDYLTAQAFGDSFDCRLSAVSVSYGRDGETIGAVLKNDSSTI